MTALLLAALVGSAFAAPQDPLAKGMQSDSAVLEAIGEYYLGLSRLQLVHPAKLKEAGELRKIDEGLSHFKEARARLSEAILGLQELASAAPKEDAAPLEKGLKFVARFSDSLDEIIGSLDSGFLPEPAVFAEASFRLQDYVLYGKKRSGGVKRGKGLKFR